MPAAWWWLRACCPPWQDVPAPDAGAAGPPGPPAVVALVDRLLATDPSRRYASARAVSNDLRSIVASMGAPLGAPAAMAATAAVPAVTTVLPKSAPPPPPERRSKKMAWVIAAVVVLGLVVGGLAWPVLRDNDPTDANRVAVPSVVGLTPPAAPAARTTATLVPAPLPSSCPPAAT